MAERDKEPWIKIKQDDRYRAAMGDKPHEWVDLIVEFIQNPDIHASVKVAAVYIGGKLPEGVEDYFKGTIQKLIEHMVSGMVGGKIGDFKIRLDDDRSLVVGPNDKVTIRFEDQKVVSIHIETSD